MFQVEGEIIIKRPPEEVFDFVADERNEPRYNPHMRRAERYLGRTDRRGHSLPGRDPEHGPDPPDGRGVHRL